MPVISNSYLAHWGIPVWYFSGRKLRYDFYSSRQVPVWHTDSYGHTVHTSSTGPNEEEEDDELSEDSIRTRSNRNRYVQTYCMRRSLLGRAGSCRPLFSPCGQSLFFARPLFVVENLYFVVIQQFRGLRSALFNLLQPGHAAMMRAGKEAPRLRSNFLSTSTSIVSAIRQISF